MFALAVLVAPGMSFAQAAPAPSAASIQAQIAALLAQLQVLQSQLAASGGAGTSGSAGTPTTSGTSTWCYAFSDNLTYGASGAEVTALQTALQKDGESVQMTGTFDDQTAAAVTSFQEKYASTILAPYGLTNGTGYVGPSTRTKLNALFGCSASSTGNQLAVVRNPDVASMPLASGAANQLVGGYAVSAPSAEGVSVSSIVVGAGQNGSDFQNLRLYVNGVQFGAAQAVVADNNNYVFSGSPVRIPAGSSANVNVFADVKAVSQSLAGLAPANATTLASCTAAGLTSYSAYSCTPTTGQTMTIGGASTGSGPVVSVSLSPNTPAASLAIMNTTGNLLGTFTFSNQDAAEAVKFTNLTVTDMTASGNLPSFSNLQIGTCCKFSMLGAASAPVKIGGGYQYTFSLSNALVVPAGSSLSLSLYGDAGSYTGSSATDDSVHTFSIAGGTAFGATSNETATVIANGAAAAPVTVVRTALTLAGQSVASMPPASFEQLGSINLTANAAGDAVPNSLTLSFSGSASHAQSFLNSVVLHDPNGNDIVAADRMAQSSISGNRITWTFLPHANPLIIPAGSSYSLSVWGDLSRLPSSPNVAQSVVATIQNNADFSYYDGTDNSAVSLTLSAQQQAPITVVNLSGAGGTGGTTPSFSVSPTSVNGSGEVTFSWNIPGSLSGTSNADFTVGCVTGLTIFDITNGHTFTCGDVARPVAMNGTDVLQFMNQTGVSIQAVGQLDYGASMPLTADVTVNPSTGNTINILAPAGGEQWPLGSTQTIKWSDSAGSSNATYTVFITQANGSAAGIAGEVYGTTQLNWNVGTVTNGATLAPGSAYYVQIVKQYVNPYDYAQSPAPFSIVAGQQSQASLSITDISGIQSSYQPNQSILFTLNGIASPGSTGAAPGGQPATSARGFNVQAYLYPQGSTSYVSWANGSYNSATGLWQVTLPSASTAGTYSLSVSLYCSQTNICGAQYPALTTQVTKTIPITVTSAVSQNPTIAPSALSFTGTQGGANPAAQTLTFSPSLPIGWQVSWNCNAIVNGSVNCGWMKMDTTTNGGGFTSATFTPNTSGLSAGTYSGTVFIINSSLSTYQTVPVTLTINPPAASAYGTLSAGLDASTPASQTVSAGQSGVTFASVKFSAAGGPVNLTYVGAGSNSANAISSLSNIRVYNGSTLLGSVANLSAGGVTGAQANVFFNQTVSIPNGGSVVLTYVADIAPSASGALDLGLSGSFGGNYATVANQSFIILGNNMTVGSSAPKLPVACPDIMPYCPYGGHTVLESNGCSMTVCNSAPVTVQPTVSQVQNLSATANGTAVALSWSAATATNGIGVYNIYRSTTPNFTPSASNRIVQGNVLSYTDSGLAAGTYYYAVAAQDMNGLVGTPSSQVSATVSPVTIAPLPIIKPILTPVTGGLFHAAATDTSNQTAIVSQSLQGMLSQLESLLKSL